MSTSRQDELNEWQWPRRPTNEVEFDAMMTSLDGLLAAKGTEPRGRGMAAAMQLSWTLKLRRSDSRRATKPRRALLAERSARSCSRMVLRPLWRRHEGRLIARLLPCGGQRQSLEDSPSKDHGRRRDRDQSGPRNVPREWRRQRHRGSQRIVFSGGPDSTDGKQTFRPRTVVIRPSLCTRLARHHGLGVAWRSFALLRSKSRFSTQCRCHPEQTRVWQGAVGGCTVRRKAPQRLPSPSWTCVPDDCRQGS